MALIQVCEILSFAQVYYHSSKVTGATDAMDA